MEYPQVTGPARPLTPLAVPLLLDPRLDPDTDHPALAEDPFGPTPANPASDTVRPEPCGAPDCDHGWINTTRPDGRPGQAPCPICPPGVRTWTPTTEDGAATAWDPLNPPF